jgi:hypothetical protein
LALRRAVARGVGHGHRRHPRPAEHLLLRQRGRRGVEDHGRGEDLARSVAAGDLGRDRCAGDRPLRPERHLRRHGPGGRALGHHGGRRDVPLGRRGRELDPRRARRHPAHRRDPGGPEGPEPGAGRGAGPRLRAEPGARRLSHDRRRQELAAPAGPGRLDRRRGPRLGSGESRGRVRRGVADANASVARLLPAAGGTRVGHLSERRRRAPLAPARRRTPHGERRTHRAGRRARQRRPDRLRHARVRGLPRHRRERAADLQRHLPLGRRRSQLAVHER